MATETHTPSLVEASSKSSTVTSLVTIALVPLLLVSLVVAAATGNTVSSHVTISLVPLLFVLVLLHRKIATFHKRVPGKSPHLPPRPAQWPIIGNVHQMLSNKPAFRWIHHLMKEMNTDIACFRFGNVHIIPITCPKIALEVLRKHDAAFASRPTTFAAEVFSSRYKATIMSPLGDQWKKMKRVLTCELLCPAMEYRFRDKRKEEADHLVKYVYGQCKQSRGVNIRTAARHYCANFIRRLMFNKRYFGELVLDGAPGLDEVDHVDALFTAIDYIYAFCVSDYFPALLGLDLDGHAEAVRGATRTFSRLHDPIIDERIQQWRLLRKGDERREVGDFLDVLITLEDADGRPLLTVEEIKAQTIDILIATIDNPSNAVEWALAEMVNNPEILQKAIDEIDTVVGKERLVEESDICQLNYLKACIREAFRIHPYHPFNPPHLAMADTTISGYLVPKGSQVILSRIGLGRNPEVWDNPLEFKPERHLNDGTSDVNVVLTEPDLRFISFSTGRRSCPGVSLGTSITMMLFARLLQGFTWSKPPSVARIELSESAKGLTLAEPLVLQAEPRLPLHLYAGK